MFLGVHRETLLTFGMRSSDLIRDDSTQIWRLTASLYLSHGLMTILLTSLAQLVPGCLLESILKGPRMAFFYLYVGTVANAFGVGLTSDSKSSLGPTPALYGMLTGVGATYVYYWQFI